MPCNIWPSIFTKLYIDKGNKIKLLFNKAPIFLAKGSILKIAEFFRRAFNVGAFEEHLVLLNLLVVLFLIFYFSIEMVVREMGNSIMQVQLNCLKFYKIV